MPTNSDAAQVLEVLTWARDNAVAVAAVTCGTCTVSLFEPRAAGAGKQDETRRSSSSIYEQLGGEVWKNAVRAGDIEGAGHGADNGEDLEPAVGNG